MDSGQQQNDTSPKETTTPGQELKLDRKENITHQRPPDNPYDLVAAPNNQYATQFTPPLGYSLRYSASAPAIPLAYGSPISFTSYGLQEPKFSPHYSLDYPEYRLPQPYLPPQGSFDSAVPYSSPAYLPSPSYAVPASRTGSVSYSDNTVTNTTASGPRDSLFFGVGLETSESTAEHNESFHQISSRHSSNLKRTSAPDLTKDTLDKSYKVRNHDYKKFFAPGRVFSTLITEPYYGAPTDENRKFDGVYYVAYGQRVYSKVRLFIVVKMYDLFCTCVSITRYGARERKTKFGSEVYGLIYSRGEPEIIEGIHKQPLRVVVSKHGEEIQPRTLVNYAQRQTVHLNWRVKDVGRLDEDSLKLLKKYFKEAVFDDEDASNSNPAELQYAPTPGKLPGDEKPSRDDKKGPNAQVTAMNQPSGRDTTATSTQSPRYPSTLSTSQLPEDFAAIDLSPITKEPPDLNPTGPDTELEPSTMDVIKDLDPGFTAITKPHRYFIIGRVFKTLWTEPLGITSNTPTTLDPHFHYPISYSQYALSKIQRFVVIRSRPNSCICLPLFTYGGQGASKSDARPKDHAAVYAVSEKAITSGGKLAADEGMDKEPFGVIVEEKGERIDPMTRINFAQVYTVQHNVKVKRVGRVTKVQIERLDRYFVESVTRR